MNVLTPTYPAHERNESASTTAAGNHSHRMQRSAGNIVTRPVEKPRRGIAGGNALQKELEMSRKSREQRGQCHATDCDDPLPQEATRRRRYCSNACRVRAWRHRQKQEE